MLMADYKPPQETPNCTCMESGLNPMFCMEGHLLECHVGLDCEEAQCSHYLAMTHEAWEETHEFGACCACQKDDGTVRNFVMFDKKAPVEGTGWGCVVCGLGMDGAMAIVCDTCIRKGIKPTLIVDGYPKDKKRVPASSLTEEFKHDERKHIEQGELIR